MYISLCHFYQCTETSVFSVYQGTGPSFNQIYPYSIWMETEAKANCRLCFLGENGHPHASIKTVWQTNCERKKQVFLHLHQCRRFSLTSDDNLCTSQMSDPDPSYQFGSGNLIWILTDPDPQPRFQGIIIMHMNKSRIKFRQSQIYI